MGGKLEDDAVLCDKARRIFALPEKVYKVRHEGKYFRMEGYHLCQPSPQRTPTLFQAGSSSKGRQFAARHAECVFIGGRNHNVARSIVSDIRQRVEAAGR
jgi:alkanesulfonate monooxygenase SsuD/methylene tetrahydromethanopterin reductase-like flavin-dependent oxidoreductase (luciferase family)